MSKTEDLEDHACMSFWWPAVEDSGVQAPETWMIRLECDLTSYPLEDGMDHFRIDQFDRLHVWISDIIAEHGLPKFLRTGHLSAKHEWVRSCFVQDPLEVGYHITTIVEYSEMAGFLGPRLRTNVWALREMIDTKPLFYAFGEMPITREFRFFVEDGKISHIQPYWPPDSIDGCTGDLDWGRKLGKASVITANESGDLGEQSLSVASRLPGDWSIDWLQDRDGKWWLTDMAPASLSFRWDPGKPQGSSEHQDINDAASIILEKKEGEGDG